MILKKECVTPHNDKERYYTRLNTSDFIFSSSYPEVISVDDEGNIKGMKRGTAVISAKMKYGMGHNLKLTIHVWSEEDTYQQ